MTAGCITQPPAQTPRIAFPDEPLRELATAAFADALTGRRLAPEVSALVSRAHRAGERLVNANPVSIPAADWVFAVFEDPVMHAFALPGGIIGINAGLIAFATSEAEIAIVMAREIAILELKLPHARMVEALSLLAANAPDAVLDETTRTRRALRMATGLDQADGIVLPFSRDDVWAVDAAGLLMAARAGYDPRAALTFWARLDAIEKATGLPPPYLVTHPGYGRRHARLRRIMPEAIAAYEHAHQGGVAPDSP